MKKPYAIYHQHDVDNGYGDAIFQEDHVETVYVTEEEIQAFVEKWDHPEVKQYGHNWMWSDGREDIMKRYLEELDKIREEYQQ